MYDIEAGKRISRQKKYFQSKNPGEVLFCRTESMPSFELHWIMELSENSLSAVQSRSYINKVNTNFVKKMREACQTIYKYDDDSIPTPEVYFSIGAVTAAMSGEPVIFAGDTGWCEPCIDTLDDIEKIDFNPDNPWIQLHLKVAQDLIDKWEGDFCVLPFIHRSPLDAANGLRGNDLFTDFYDNPDMVKELISKCADWTIKTEQFLRDNLTYPDGIERGVWSVYLPEHAIFINGDPVDLISAKQQKEFELPYTEKIFMLAGGGFYHHHALGIRQVENVSEVKNLFVQNIYTDPNQPIPIENMMENKEVKDAVVKSSLKAPIHLNGDFYPMTDKMVSVLKEGRFILRHEGDDQYSEVILQKLKDLRIWI